MKASSSLLVALIGGPDSFAFVFPPIAANPIAPTVPRVAIASYSRRLISSQSSGLYMLEECSRFVGLGGGGWAPYDVCSDLAAHDLIHDDHDEGTKQEGWEFVTVGAMEEQLIKNIQCCI